MAKKTTIIATAIKAETPVKNILGYKLVKDYPLQKIGDKVIRSAARVTTSWIFEKSKVAVPEAILFTEFFQPIYSKYGTGDLLIYQGELVKIGRILNTKYEILYVNRQGNGSALESELSKIKTYWFFNSKLEACQDNLTTTKKVAEAKERKALGNYFDTKEEVNAVIAKIKAIL